MMSSNTQAAGSGRNAKTKSSIRVAIVGGGFGGVIAAVRLQRAGIADFHIYEKSSSPGGVWWDNRYPGAEVDTPSHMYSFSFMRYDWSRSYIQQEELLEYINATIDHFRLRPHFRLSSHVDGVVWNEERQQYAVSVNGDEAWYDFVISAVGLLNVPRFPTWPGMEQFLGPMFHTSQWDDSIDLTGKRVAIVGTGSTAIQIVSQIAPKVAELTVFQREPNWPVAKGIVEYSPEQRRRFRNPIRYKWERIVHGYLPREREWFLNRVNRLGTGPNTRGERNSRAMINRQLAGRPDLIELVTPDFPFMGKRPARDDYYLPALTGENVRLVARAVERVTSNGLVDVDGVEREFDVVILSTGFQPSRFLAHLPVTGRDGVTLDSYWGDTPRAFLGVTVPNFPNFFMLYGPNTNGYAILFLLEHAADFAIRSIKRVIRLKGTAVETKQSYLTRYKRWIDKRTAKSVWVRSNNYYSSAGGTVVTQWVDGMALYWLLEKCLLRISATVSRGPRPRRHAAGDRVRELAQGRRL